MLNPIREKVRHARATGRFLWSTGVLRNMRPAGLRILIDQRLRGGGGGPSLLYRVNAANQPLKEAVVCGDRSFTFKELNERIDRLANALCDRFAFKRGDTAMVITRNRVEVLEAQAALSRLGASAVSVSWRSTADELRYLANDCQARAIFVEAPVADATLEAAPDVPSLAPGGLIGIGDAHRDLTAYEDLLYTGAAEPPAAGDGGSVIIYTSGTTGRPKGAVREFPKEAQDAILHFIGETPIHHTDRHLAVCPMYHSTAFAFIGFTLAVGGSTVILPGFDPEAVLATVQSQRITTAAMVPTMLHRLLELPEAVTRQYDTSSLMAIFSGGAPLTGDLAARFMKRFGRVLYNFYGATETGINTLATPDELLRAPGTIGHVVTGNEIRLLDDEGRAVSPGETGEVFVRNSMLISRYHRNQTATRASQRDGFFSVGDLAHFDRHGLLHIDGRKRDMIISGGVNVYPAEIEEVIAQHPSVAEAAVLGVPSDEWGETVRAFVVLLDGEAADDADLLSFCRSRLAGPKRPRELYFIDTLPKNPTGKVLKRQLRDWSPEGEVRS